MHGTSELIAIHIALIATMTYAQPKAVESKAQPGFAVLATSIEKALQSGDLQKLRPLMASNAFTFNLQGDIEPNIKCFLAWSVGCSGPKVPVRGILSEPHFRYYHHINKGNVIVSFIKESRRGEFYANREAFLEKNYLKDYFSCQMTFAKNGWALKESLCFSETEGPFEKEPNV